MHEPAGDSSTPANGGAPALVVCWLPFSGSGTQELERLLQRLPEEIALCVGVGDGAEQGLAHSIRSTGRTVHEVEAAGTTTLAAVANAAHRRWAAADLILLSSPAALPDGWVERLRDAAASESSAATVSALPSGLLADPRWSSGRAAAVADQSLRLYPRIPGAMLPCVYLRSSALDLVGPLQEGLPTSDAAVLSFALGAREHGLANLLADDLLVEAADAAPAIGAARDALSALPQAELLADAGRPTKPALERSIAVASVAGERLSVTIDARTLGPRVGGTQEYVLGLIRALADTNEVQLRILVAPDLSPTVEAQLRALPGCELLGYEAVVAQTSASDIVHRPQQVFSEDDLTLLRPLGRRVVITHHDLIAYNNPLYFDSVEHWDRYVRTTRQALGVADQVLFFSAHARDDARREDLIDPSRSTVTYLGVEPADSHASGASRVQSGAPARATTLGETPFLLCIGADYLHKNRPFAIALLDELRRRHGWKGALVLAGPHVEHGSSRVLEQDEIARRSLASDLVLDLGTISDEERAWLMGSAAAVVYPTVHEGFGLVPFESAAAGVPCLFAPQSSLGELLDAELATLEPWSAERSAGRSIGLLHDGPARSRHVERLARTARELSWSECAKGTVAAYRKAIAAPYRTASADAWQALQREQEIVRLDRGATELGTRLRQLMDDLGDDALALVGPRALLSRSDQHALLAVAARPALKRSVFGALRGIFRLLHTIRRPRS
jgi:glycosyltransferase involved in cell wall biosynthesis